MSDNSSEKTQKHSFGRHVILTKAAELSGKDISQFWLSSAEKIGIPLKVAKEGLAEYFISVQAFPEINIKIPGYIQTAAQKIVMENESRKKKKNRHRMRRAALGAEETHPAFSSRF